MTARRRLLILLALGCVFLLSLVRLTVFFSGALLARGLSDFFERETTVGQVTLHLWPPSAEVHGLRVAGADPASPPFLEIARVVVVPSLAQAWERRLALRELRLESPRVRINAFKEGGDDLPPMGRGAGAPGRAVRLDRLVVQGGEIILDHERVPVEVDLPDFQGRLDVRRDRALAGRVTFGPGDLRFGDAPRLEVASEIALVLVGRRLVLESGRIHAAKMDLKAQGEIRFGAPTRGEVAVTGPVDLGVLDRHVVRTGLGLTGDATIDATVSLEGAKVAIAGHAAGRPRDLRHPVHSRLLRRLRVGRQRPPAHGALGRDPGRHGAPRGGCALGGSPAGRCGSRDGSTESMPSAWRPPCSAWERRGWGPERPASSSSAGRAATRVRSRGRWTWSSRPAPTGARPSPAGSSGRRRAAISRWTRRCCTRRCWRPSSTAVSSRTGAPTCASKRRAATSGRPKSSCEGCGAPWATPRRRWWASRARESSAGTGEGASTPPSSKAASTARTSRGAACPGARPAPPAPSPRAPSRPARSSCAAGRARSSWTAASRPATSGSTTAWRAGCGSSAGPPPISSGPSTGSFPWKGPSPATPPCAAAAALPRARRPSRPVRGAISAEPSRRRG